MKKMVLCFVVLFGGVLLLTGCGLNSRLECTQESSGVNITYNIDFSGNKIKSMDFGYDMDLSKFTDTQISMVEKQDFCSTVSSSMTQYKDAFKDCKQSIKNKHLSVTAAFEVDKIAKTELDKMSSPKATKKELEKSGYTCKLK